jgi:hypothetical protein
VQVHGAFVHGVAAQLKCLTDEFTKEGLAINVDGRIRSPRIINVLARRVGAERLRLTTPQPAPCPRCSRQLSRASAPMILQPVHPTRRGGWG